LKFPARQYMFTAFAKKGVGNMEKIKTENIGNWKLDPDATVSVGDFNNTTNKDDCTFPGQYEGDGIFMVQNPNKVPLKLCPFCESDYSYFYKGDGYFYGITKENEEVIAILTDDGRIIPTVKGAGSYKFKKRNGDNLLSSNGIKNYTVEENNGYTSVSVNYDFTAKSGYAKLCNTYTFKENCISATVSVSAYDLAEGMFEPLFKREYINEFEHYVKKVSLDWQYPHNNDFAYKETDAVVFSEKYGENYFVTAIRDKNSTNKVKIRHIDSSAHPLNIKPNSTDVEYCFNIDYAFVKADEKAHYIGLYKTKNADFAAGVSAVGGNGNSTLFMGKNLHLNINVTNVTKGDINFAVKYEILGYYENRVLQKTVFSNTLSVGCEANHNIKISLNDYGMYFLNLYIVSKNQEYRETYPFCMLEEYEWKHRDESPFGICATHTETIGQARTTAEILGKMGLSIIRDGNCIDTPKFHEFLKENGVKRWSCPNGRCLEESKVDSYVASLRQKGHIYDEDNYAYYFVANEIDAPAKCNYEKSYKLLTEKYIPYTYKPFHDFIAAEHPKALKKMIWQSNCHGTTEWLEAFYDTGMWDNSEFIDIHTYSSPSGPDKLFSNTRISMHANTFSNEYAMDRWKRIKKRYGEKRMIVGETGYPTAPFIGDRAEVDPRTAADFNVRIACFLLEAGCEDILYYCIYDRTSFFIGTSSWNEMYFGALYNYDYNGVYMPKPWTAAYANLTRRFDGYKKVSFFDKYEESEFGTLRAFKVEKDGEEFAVLWSNVYKQPNTTAEGRMVHEERIPMPLWSNRWIETEIREFDAVGDTVTVVDVMGNSREIKAENGKVKIEISGSPIYVYGIC